MKTNIQIFPIVMKENLYIDGKNCQKIMNGFNPVNIVLYGTVPNIVLCFYLHNYCL